jgi:hypothetical protein
MVLTDALDDVGVFDESLEPLEGTGRLRSVRRRASRELTPQAHDWWTQATSWLELVPSTAFGARR